ncbi:hypothetical protein C0992_002094 [Termitomyces sp. T32_za158]|nr:hypothetical protein C0992_002094 [Termitomyces sp. T32_za158]
MDLTKIILTPIVNVYIHRLLDAHLVTFWLDKDLLQIIKEKLLVNKTATFEQRQRILTDLDQEMPEGGWPVILMATHKCDRTEAIMVHELMNNENGEVITAETYQVFRHPFKIPFKTAASPIFILENMYQKHKNLDMVREEWYKTNWTGRQLAQFHSGVYLIKDLVEDVHVPDTFKRRAGRSTRRSCRGEAVLGQPQERYNYRLAKYEAVVARDAQYDNAKDQHHTDSEEEHHLDSDSEEKSSDPVSLMEAQPIVNNGYNFYADEDFDDGPIERQWDFSEDEKDRRSPDSSELSSEYVDDETGSEIGGRESPLRLRSRSHPES